MTFLCAASISLEAIVVTQLVRIGIALASSKASIARFSKVGLRTFEERSS